LWALPKTAKDALEPNVTCLRLSLLHAYYYGSLPYRRWANRRAESRRRAAVMVFTYHRVSDDQANPWTMPNRTFARQIAWLRRHLELVSLAEARRRIVAADNPRLCGAITFDDGYADNCEEAIPLLLREQVPCTYFVTLRNVLTGTPFPHDEKRGDRFAPNTLSQLRSMAAAGIEIAAHSYTHADLGRLTSRRELRREIVLAGQELGDLLGRRVRYFAFPFGLRDNLSQAAFAMAHEAGYEAACSAYGGYNYPGDDGFHLQRIPTDSCTIRLRNVATVDPRKIHTARFAWTRNEGRATNDEGRGTRVEGSGFRVQGSEPGCVSPVNVSEPGRVSPEDPVAGLPFVMEPSSQHWNPTT
jgi:peptidoglycan/xylan/chitin deacetylase (PgdA/CDA1 family)